MKTNLVIFLSIADFYCDGCGWHWCVPTGHLMFCQVGDYWSDVGQFLKQHL